MATRTAPEIDAVVPAPERNPPAGILFNVWMPILAGVLSVLLCWIVMLQE
jgi:hypothetical protein